MVFPAVAPACIGSALCFQFLLCTDVICRDGEIICPLGRIGTSGRIDTFGGRCVNESFACDGIQDCVGGTDEVNCGFCKTFIAILVLITY